MSTALTFNIASEGVSISAVGNESLYSPGVNRNTNHHPLINPQSLTEEELLNRTESWILELPADFGVKVIADEDFSDRTVTLLRRNHLDYTGYPIPVEIVDSDVGLETNILNEFEYTGISHLIEIAQRIESRKFPLTTHTTLAINQIVAASKDLDLDCLPNGHKVWNEDVVVPILDEAIRIFRELSIEREGNISDSDDGESNETDKEKSKTEEFLDWFHLPGDLLRPYVMSGVVVPLDEKYHLGFDLFQQFRLGHRMSMDLQAKQGETVPLKVNPRTFHGVIGLIRPCTTKPAGPANQQHRFLHALHRLAPTIQEHSRYLWHINNILTKQVPASEKFEIWLPVLLYENPSWYFFVARTNQGKMTAVKFEWSTSTNSVAGCKKLLSLLVALLSWAKYSHLAWLIDHVFESPGDLDEVWDSEMAEVLDELFENEPLEKLQQLLPCGPLVD